MRIHYKHQVTNVNYGGPCTEETGSHKIGFIKLETMVSSKTVFVLNRRSYTLSH
jgi:hypothetical protein